MKINWKVTIGLLCIGAFIFFAYEAFNTASDMLDGAEESADNALAGIEDSISDGVSSLAAIPGNVINSLSSSAGGNGIIAGIANVWSMFIGGAS